MHKIKAKQGTDWMVKLNFSTYFKILDIWYGTDILFQNDYLKTEVNFKQTDLHV